MLYCIHTITMHTNCIIHFNQAVLTCITETIAILSNDIFIATTQNKILNHTHFNYLPGILMELGGGGGGGRRDDEELWPLIKVLVSLCIKTINQIKTP